MLRTLDDAFSLDQSFQTAALAGFSLVSIVVVIYELVRWSGRIRGFGGPMGLPVVGNLLQIQGKDAPEQYRIWSKTYGSVYQIALGSIPVLVINSAAAAKALFIQNSQACASRPEFYTFHKVSFPATGARYSTELLPRLSRILRGQRLAPLLILKVFGDVAKQRPPLSTVPRWKAISHISIKKQKSFWQRHLDTETLARKGSIQHHSSFA